MRYIIITTLTIAICMVPSYATGSPLDSPLTSPLPTSTPSVIPSPTPSTTVVTTPAPTTSLPTPSVPTVVDGGDLTAGGDGLIVGLIVWVFILLAAVTAVALVAVVTLT